MKSFKERQLYSILFNKCPRCHQGSFYKITNPYRAFFKKEVLHKGCSECGQAFEPETGFYYGAMYVSYILNVLVFISIWVLLQLFFPYEFPVLATVLIIALGLVAVAPISLYYSRLIWIAFFVKYKKGV